MQRALILRHLVEIEEHVALGRRHIEAQQARVKELPADGNDADRAKRVLATFQQCQAFHEQHLDQLLQELEKQISPGKTGRPGIA